MQSQNKRLSFKPKANGSNLARCHASQGISLINCSTSGLIHCSSYVLFSSSMHLNRAISLTISLLPCLLLHLNTGDVALAKDAHGAQLLHECPDVTFSLSYQAYKKDSLSSVPLGSMMVIPKTAVQCNWTF